MIGFTAWTARHRRSLLFALLLPIVAGLASTFTMPVTLFPGVTFPRVRVSLEAGDRPAEQMALLVTRPLEQAVYRVPGVSSVRSTTTRGTAELSITFSWGIDMVAAELQIGAAINQQLPNLPPGTTAGIRRMDPTVFPIIAYSLTSDRLTPVQLRDLARFQLAPLLTGVPGVSEVGVVGGRDEELQVVVDPDRLAAQGLALDDIVKAVASANLVQAVGRIEDRYKLFLVVSDNVLADVQALRAVPLKSGPAGVVTLGTIAEVSDGTVPQWTRVTADGRDAVLLNVYQQRDGNSVKIARDVRDRLAAFDLPKGVVVRNWYDQSQLVTASASSVRDAILVGALLAAIVLWVFLRSIRITLIAILVIPAALAATIMLIRWLGFSFNIMTLGGMAAAVGLIIDDAIVMVEHIERRVAASGYVGGVLGAAREFASPLAGSSAATLVIFVPLAFLSGVSGAFFKALSLTVGAGLLFSFMITWLAVPLVLERLQAGARHVDGAPHGFGRFIDGLKDRYATLSNRLLDRPLLPVLALLPMLLLGFLAYRNVGSGFMPAMDEGGFIIDYQSAPGTALSETDRLLEQVAGILGATPDVETWSRRTGAGLGGDLNEANKGDFFVRLKARNRRPIDEVMTELRGRIANEVPGLEVEMLQLMEDLIGDLTAVPQPIEVKIFGPDAGSLRTAARHVADAIGKIDGVVDVKDGINPAGDAIDLHVDHERAALEGVDAGTVTAQVAQYVQGSVAAQVPTPLKPIGIRIWVPESARRTDRGLGDIPIRAADGHIFPLKRVAELAHVTGEPQIVRETLQRMVAVTARIEGRDLGSAAAEVQAAVDRQHLVPAPLRYELGGLYQQQKAAFSDLMTIFAAAAAAVFVLLLFLYESFLTAVVILLMPLTAASFVLVGLWVTGTELNITAMMGMTMIIGIVTEVAIFFFSELEELGEDDLKARLVAAGRNRFRPIAMTTLAAIMTLLPLAFAIGEGSAMQQPLAIAIVSGLTAQLPLVLLVMPSLYLVSRQLLAGTFRRKR